MNFLLLCILHKYYYKCPHNISSNRCGLLKLLSSIQCWKYSCTRRFVVLFSLYFNWRVLQSLKLLNQITETPFNFPNMFIVCFLFIVLQIDHFNHLCPMSYLCIFPVHYCPHFPFHYLNLLLLDHRGDTWPLKSQDFNYSYLQGFL